MALTSLIPWKRDEKRITVHQADDPFLELRERINQLFDSFWEDPFGMVPTFEQTLAGFSPRVDVTETDKEIKVEAELPGMDEDDINVTFDRDVLTISGEKKAEKEEKHKNYYHMERHYGSFHRAIPMPVEIDADKIDAKFKKGVLTITLPKTKEAQASAKRIAVKKA